MDIQQVIIGVIGGGGVVAVIAWLRFKSKDKADTVKVSAEARKIDAETDNTIAEGFEKLMALMEVQLMSKIKEVGDLEQILRKKGEELVEAEEKFAGKERLYQAMILELTEKVHTLQKKKI